METARVRSAVAERYREPRVAWQKLIPFIFLSSAGTFVSEYNSIYAESLPWVNELGGKATYFFVFVYQAVCYGIAGWFSAYIKTFTRRSFFTEVLAAGLLIFSGMLIMFSSPSGLALAALAWWAAWPFFQLRIWWAVAFSSSKRLMSYATGMVLMVSFIVAGGMMALLDGLPGLPRHTFLGLTASLAGLSGLAIARNFRGMADASSPERKSISSAGLLVIGMMGLLTGMLWGYTEIFLPYVFKGNARTALFTGISHLYPLILMALGVFAWPAGKILSYRDSDVGFVFYGILSLLLVVVLYYAGEDTLVLSLAAALYVPAFSLTCVATLTSAAKRINMSGSQAGWKVGGTIWLSLMLGRALMVFFQ